MQTLESVIKDNFNYYFQNSFFSMPARVVGISDIENGNVDVQPLTNRQYSDMTIIEHPVIYSVPIQVPCTNTSAITLPVSVDDTVLLVFSQFGLDSFKGGSDIPYDPNDNRFLDINDAVAIVGIKPFSKSPYNPSNHSTKYDNKDVVITHNINTSNECSVNLKEDGRIVLQSPLQVTIDSPITQVSKLIVKDDALIAGTSFNQFKSSHTHNYTDNGSPAVTAPPNAI